MSGHPAVFLDKDGTLVENVPYSADPDDLALTPRAGEGLRLLAAAGYALVVVTNQSGVARGRFPESALPPLATALRSLVAHEGATLLDVCWCPHHPDGVVPGYALACSCRKPAPGLLRRAAAVHGLDLDASWLVGDILDDVEAGRRAGCRTILLDRGGETEWRLAPQRLPHFVARDLREAAEIVLGEPTGATAVSAEAAG
ncbi:MAG: HAD family hydrolase [Thermoleophilia bacterium]